MSGGRCGACGRELAPGARFCDRCGRAVAPAAPADGELRTVTALFADMSGSVAASHGADPEEAASRVNEVLDLMVAAVHRHEGRVDRFLGDGLLALFGAEQAREDDATRAVAAALDICEHVAAAGRAATAGVNTGPVYLGAVGSELHRERTAMGPVLNLAARLQGRAAPGEVLVGGDTARQVAGAFELDERRLEIKGIPDEVVAYAVTGRVSRPRRARDVAQARAALVGREGELVALRSLVDGLAAGSGGVAIVTGEAGIGKSRLVAECLAAVPDGVLVLEGRCLESGTSAYWPFVDALRGYVDGRAGDRTASAARLAGELRAMVADMAHDPEDLALQAVALAALVAGEPAGEAAADWQRLPARQRQQGTFRAVRSLLTALAERRGVLFVAEDLHWADGLSLALLGDLFGVAAEHPLVVVCTHRPVEEHGSRGLATLAGERCTRTVEIAVGELATADAERLAEALLGRPGLSPEARELLVGRAQGNPLYLEEIVHECVDSGRVALATDGWVVAGASSERGVPPSLEQLIRARVDRLDAEERRLLQLASVQGRIFSVALLREMAGDGTHVPALLDGLAERDLVFPERLVSDEEWTFKHVVVQETVYQGILRRERAELHLAALDALERLHAGREDELAPRLAHHAEAAGDDERAFRHLRTAARGARQDHANEVALDLYRRALDRGAAAGATPGELAEVLEEQGDVQALVGRHDEALSSYAAALEAPAPSPVAAATLHRKRADVRVVRREYAEALEDFDRAERAVGRRPTPDDPAWSVWLDARLARAQLFYWWGKPAEIDAILHDVGAEVDAYGSDDHVVRACLVGAMKLLRENRYVVGTEEVALTERARSIAERWADPAARCFHRFNHGFTLLWRREPAAALEVFALARADAERAGDVTTLSRCLTYIAVAHRFLGDTTSCRAASEDALGVAGEGSMVEYLGAAEANLSWVALRSGDRGEALSRAAGALDLWDGLTLVYGFQWTARFPLMAIALADGDTRGGASHAARMLHLSQQRLPDPLDVLLAEGSETSLRAAVEAGRPLGYV